MNKTKARRVDFVHNQGDMEVAVLGAMGFSTAYITEKTALTPCQVSYRLAKIEIRRKDYRNGGSAYAAAIQSRMHDIIKRALIRKVS